MQTVQKKVQNNIIAGKADELVQLAAALEKKSVTWTRYVFEESNALLRAQDEYREWQKRARVVWENAVSAGKVLDKLFEAGALEAMPRLGRAIAHIRAELSKCHRTQTLAYSYQVINVRYDIGKQTYDVYFVKMFEAFCKIWATSYEDRRAFESYYVEFKDKAAFHAKMMKALSKALNDNLANANNS